MRHRLCSAAFFLTVFATVSTAQQPVTCPWLSSGSAQTVLGGRVSLHVKVDEDGQGFCEFSSQFGSVTKMLRILIGKVDKHACSARSTQLKALGNDAMQCRRPDAQGEQWDVIAGRMRDAFFVVASNVPELAATPKDNGPPNDPYTASILERLAEQVVGNLD